MPQFAYKALQADGVLTEGFLDASNRHEAMRQVESRGLKPIKLAESAAAPAKPGAAAGSADKSAAGGAPSAGFNFSFGSKPKITPRMLENFTRLLSSLLAAGVPFSRALVILHREAAEPVAKEKWKEIHDLVIDGMSLSKAMERSPETFPRVYVAMVEAGEAGGFLDVVLAQIADFQAREKDIQSKVSAALMYPAILLFLAMGVLVFLHGVLHPAVSVGVQGLQRRAPAASRR
jgi:type IV pilus assembly protein PilC